MSTGHVVETTRPSTPRPAPDRRFPRWVPILAALACGVVLTGLWLQVLHPFIRHDDWPYSLPANAPGTSDLWARNLYEGRWLNYVAWWVAGRRVTPALAAGTFVVLHCLYIWGMVRLFRLRSALAAFVLTLAVFASPLWIQLVYWPATLSASMGVLAAAVWTLPLLRHHTWGVAAWTLGFTILAVLSYAPVAALVFLALIVHELGRPLRRLALLAVWFAASYAAGILVMYTLNWLAFGTFGVVISEWRRPNPLTDLDSLRENLVLYGRQLGRIWTLIRTAVVVSAATAVWAAFDRRVRRHLGVMALALGVVIGLEAALTLVSGVVIGTRASLWAWISVCLPGALLLGSDRRSRVVGMVSLSVIAVVGLVACRADVSAHQDTRVQYDRITAQVAQARAASPGSKVVMWMDPAVRQTARGTMTATTLRFMIYDKYRIRARWCAATDCAAIGQEAASPETGPVFRSGDLIVIDVPRPPRWL